MYTAMKSRKTIPGKTLTAIALALSMTTISSCANAGPDMKRADVKEIIQEYLMENPEIIREALIELERKEDAAAMAAVYDAIYKDPRDIAIGPKDAKVTIVEFFDYNCGYCKTSTDWVRETIDKHPEDVRVIFKELPILDGRSKTSKAASRAALAAGRQGKYSTMHFSLMKERSLTKERIEIIAEKAGLDMKKFNKDIKDPAIDRQLDDALALASRIPDLTGTPFFMIGDETISGANVNRLQQLLDDALKS